jgi:hypothetical protein
MSEVTEAGESSRLSKVVAVPVLLGAEQTWAEGCEGVAGESAGRIVRRKQAVVASISYQLAQVKMTHNIWHLHAARSCPDSAILKNCP